MCKHWETNYIDAVIVGGAMAGVVLVAIVGRAIARAVGFAISGPEKGKTLLRTLQLKPMFITN